MRSELDDRLRDMHRRPAPGQDEHRRTHEPSVMAAFARRHGGASARRWPRLPRLALGGVLGVAVAVGACALPAEYPVSLGYGLEITLEGSSSVPLDEQAIARHVRARPGAERVELRVARHIETGVGPDGQEVTGEQVQLQLFVFGGALDTDALWRDLQADFPALADAEIHDVPLAGTVQGTLGGKLSHRLLDLTVDRHGVEEAERRILAELVAEGIDPDNATVDIEQSTDAQGHRRIEVRVEAEQPR